MKRIISFVLTIICLLFSVVTVFAGDSDVDIGGGGSDDMGSGSSQNKWSGGRDGVRVTVVNTKSGTPVTVSVDITNRTGLTNYLHFGKVAKTQYLKGTSLSLQMGNYTFKNPSPALPNIIHSGASPANIDATRNYFSRKVSIEQISLWVGMPYDTLINGDYKLLIEPIMYVTYMGSNFAMTAHECALYDELVNGDIWRKFTDISHKNLPLAIFLERGGLGIPAWTGTTTGRVNNAQIKQSLGVGIVSFKDDDEEEPEEPEPPLPEAPDQSGRLMGIGQDVYRVDTDVITSFWLQDTSGDGVSPDDGATATVNIGDTTYYIPYVIPPNDSTLIWVKWHTPSTPTTIAINADCTNGRVQDSAKSMRIIDLNLEEPPNPEGRDLRDGWTFQNSSPYPETVENTWNEWDAWWYSIIVMTPAGPVDMGYWVYDPVFYSASMSLSQQLSTYSKTATTKYDKITMKSAYGVYMNAVTEVDTNAASSNFTPIQTVISAFPEFKYVKYYRLLEDSGSGRFRFPKNPFSQFEDFLHFTPIWYSDKQEYPVQVVALDCWTPAGMLTLNGVTDNLRIDGNVYDDWFIAPTK